jgi:two-component system response regulator
MAAVLLVEDDAEDVEITQTAFVKGSIPNPLHVVRSGEAALEFLQHTGRYADLTETPRPGLILLDLHLPGLNGCEVLKQIKSDRGLRRIPVVVLTTSSEEADVLRCYDVGANTYITKPVEFDKFLEAVLTIGKYWLLVAQIPEDGEVPEA